MTKAKIVLAAALALPLASFSIAAEAASAHNIQSGAHTSNAYDTAESANAKQVRNDRRSIWRYDQPETAPDR